MAASEQPEPLRDTSLFAALIAAADDAIIATALDGTIHAWNDGAARLYGYACEEMVGRSIAELATPDHSEELVEALEVIATATRIEPFDSMRLHRSGRQVEVFTGVSPIRSHTGEVVGASWIERDVTGRRHVERMISHLAFHDPLTGLANRTLLVDRLQQSLERTRRTGGLVAAIYLDLDDFKAINDRLGHPTGDKVLQQVAHRLQQLLRPEDTLARLGGDEFVVVSDQVPSIEAACSIADRLQAALMPPMDFETARIAITASIGVAVGGTGIDADRLLANADRAMYTAKTQGGGIAASTPSSERV